MGRTVRPSAAARSGAPEASMLSEEIHYRLLKALDQDPHLSQRELAGALGISLGRVNYCLKALVQKGLIKVENFRSANRKSSYVYLLTPRGLRSKAEITLAFLRRKQDEYDQLQQEIERLRSEVRREKGLVD